MSKLYEEKRYDEIIKVFHRVSKNESSHRVTEIYMDALIEKVNKNQISFNQKS